MNDRELLRYAAIACGELIGEWISNEDYLDGVLTRWNPLTDDGDALRLAETIGLIVDFYHCRAISGSRYYAGHRDWIYSEESTDDIKEAIVRCAAEIGKSIP